MSQYSDVLVLECFSDTDSHIFHASSYRLIVVPRFSHTHTHTHTHTKKNPPNYNHNISLAPAARLRESTTRNVKIKARIHQPLYRDQCSRANA